MLQAIALFEFKAAEENELSIYKSEIVEVVTKDDDWWTIKNKYGQSGLVPVTYLAAPVDDDAEIKLRGKTKKSYKARTDNEVSVEKDKQIAVIDNSDDYWWFVGFNGQTGYIPKNIVHVLNRPGKAELFGLKVVAPDNAQCDEESTVLFSFQKPLPEQGQYIIIFKGNHCEKVVDGVRLNDFTLKTTTPKYYPAEQTKITINHQLPGQVQQLIAKDVKFTFQSKLDLVHKILSTESDPMNFLCSSFQIERGDDLQNVDRILSGNLEKKVPEGIDLLKNSKSVLVQDQVHPKETPTLLHFAAYYNLKKLAKSLLRCPGAKEAMSIKNCHGNGPTAVAQLKKHDEMEELLQNHQTTDDLDDSCEDEYMKMEDCLARYTKMDGRYEPEYIVPDSLQRSQTSKAEDGDDIYEDMDGGSQNSEELYDKPRPECEDRFETYDEELDDNANKIQNESAMQQKIDEYKVFGRMTEKEVQLALLMKRVKERYITQEQALEMARVLHLEPQPGKKPDPKKKNNVNKRISTPNMAEVLERKTQSLPRTMSTSSGSSVSSTGSVNSTGSGYTSDGIGRPPATKPKIPAGGRGFNYRHGSASPVSPKKSVSPPPTTPRKVARSPSDPPAPPVPVRRTRATYQSRQ